MMEKKLKVLIADNSTEFGQACAAVLKTYGMEVINTAKDGLKLMEDIKDLRPDVVLADVFMSRQDILGVLGQIKTADLPTKPMIMAMSSFDNPRLEQETLNAGAAYYFLKPFDFDMLAERIVQLTGWKNGREPMAHSRNRIWK